MKFYIKIARNFYIFHVGILLTILLVKFPERRISKGAKIKENLSDGAFLYCI